MSSRQERVDDYRTRLDADVRAVLREYQITPLEVHDTFHEALVEDLVEVAMHHIEHLVLEVTR